VNVCRWLSPLFEFFELVTRVFQLIVPARGHILLVISFQPIFPAIPLAIVVFGCLLPLAIVVFGCLLSPIGVPSVEDRYCGCEDEEKKGEAYRVPGVVGDRAEIHGRFWMWIGGSRILLYYTLDEPDDDDGDSDGDGGLDRGLSMGKPNANLTVT